MLRAILDAETFKTKKVSKNKFSDIFSEIHDEIVNFCFGVEVLNI